MSFRAEKLSRRHFLSGGGALVIGFTLPKRALATGIDQTAKNEFASDALAFSPDAFLRISQDNTVTIVSKHLEMGQGIYTGIATMIADELDADWSQMRAIAAPVDHAVYKNFTLGFQGTGSSSSIAESYAQMRYIGAMAKQMLVQAAANMWHVSVNDITVSNGVIKNNKTGKTAPFGQFATHAAKLKPPTVAEVKLKKPAEFTLMGKNDPTFKRLDNDAKTDGTAIFTQDIFEPNMLTVVIRKSPRFGGKITSFDANEALKIPDVVAVKRVGSGIAVYAKNTWAALRGRDALRVKWDDSTAEKRSTKQIFAEFKSKTTNTGIIAQQYGNTTAAFNKGEVIETDYYFPFIAHAPMEPVDGYVEWSGKDIYAKYGCQIPTLDHAQFCKFFDLPPEKVKIDTILAGGSFGRRIDIGGNNYGNDFVYDMCTAAKTLGPGCKIKLIWTREDDITGGWYRPMMMHRMKAAIRDNKIVGWTDSIIGHSFAIGTPMQGAVQNGVDSFMTDGSINLPYKLNSFRCDTQIVPSQIPSTTMRSVGSTHTVHAVECFIDEVLSKLGKDPVSGRLEIMDANSRYAGVLKAAANAANWKGPGPTNNKAMGVALTKAFNTYVCLVAEVSIDQIRQIPQVHRVWCAVDCGAIVNPNMIKAQIEGGILFGLNIALFGAITLKDGIVEQSNFNDYRPIRMNQVPEINVIPISSTEPPTGIGELGVPCVAPAVANALAYLGVNRKQMNLPFFSQLV